MSNEVAKQENCHDPYKDHLDHLVHDTNVLSAGLLKPYDYISFHIRKKTKSFCYIVKREKKTSLKQYRTTYERNPE